MRVPANSRRQADLLKPFFSHVVVRTSSIETSGEIFMVVCTPPGRRTLTRTSVELDGVPEGKGALASWSTSDGSCTRIVGTSGELTLLGLEEDGEGSIARGGGEMVLVSFEGPTGWTGEAPIEAPVSLLSPPSSSIISRARRTDMCPTVAMGVTGVSTEILLLAELDRGLLPPPPPPPPLLLLLMVSSLPPAGNSEGSASSTFSMLIVRTMSLTLVDWISAVR